MIGGSREARLFQRADAAPGRIPAAASLASLLKSNSSLWIAAALVGLAAGIHHGWLTFQPLAAGDSPWVSSGRLLSYGPWPTLWDPTSGFGRAAFDQANLAPNGAVEALLAKVGIGFSVQEKLLFFWPFAVLSVLAPWALGRELLGSVRWAAVCAAIFATNTHILLRGAAHLGIATAMCLGVLVFWADIRAKRRLDPRWAGVAGLLLALETIYDLRIAVLTVLCLLIKVVIEVIASPSMRARGSLAGMFAISLALLGITQLGWLVPLAAYRGQPSLPIPAAPAVAFASLAHAFTAQDPAWTGGSPVFSRSTVIPWETYLIPLIAFGALLFRRIRLEIAWLLLLALIAAFLIKQDNPPFVGVYTWLFQHLPGWELFRDGTKLSWIVGIAYAVAIPLVARAAWRRLASHRWLATGCVALLLGAPAAQVVQASTATARGYLGETTQATHEPRSFVQLESLLDADPHRSFVAYFGEAATFDTVVHRFEIASVTHPDLELSGTTQPYDPASPDDDPLNAFCTGIQTPFCYLQPELFPYLAHEFGIGYVVAPLGTAVGVVPDGVGRAQLASRLTSLLGKQPVVIGDQRDGIAVWRLPASASTVTASSWLARVHGPSQSLSLALPALRALGAPPPIFDGSSKASAVAPPDAIAVVPCLDQGYNVPTPGEYAIAVPNGQPIPTQLSIAGQTQHIGALANLAGVTVAGPIALAKGATRLAGVGCGDPLVAWSSQTAHALSPPHAAEAAAPYTSTGNETLTITAPASGWVIYRQGYDVGWRLGGSDFHTAAGPFNAFHVAGRASGVLALRFSTLPWEIGGAIAAGVLTIAFLGLLWRPRRRRSNVRESAQITVSSRHSGWWLALVGLACGVVAMIAQALTNAGSTSSAGSFSEVLSTRGGQDVYSAPVFYVAVAMMAFLLAIVMAFITWRPVSAIDREAGRGVHRGGHDAESSPWSRL